MSFDTYRYGWNKRGIDGWRRWDQGGRGATWAERGGAEAKHATVPRRWAGRRHNRRWRRGRWTHRRGRRWTHRRGRRWTHRRGRRWTHRRGRRWTHRRGSVVGRARGRLAEIAHLLGKLADPVPSRIVLTHNILSVRACLIPAPNLEGVFPHDLREMPRLAGEARLGQVVIQRLLVDPELRSIFAVEVRPDCKVLAVLRITVRKHAGVCNSLSGLGQGLRPQQRRRASSSPGLIVEV